MSKIIDLTNQKFNKLTVLYRNGSKGGKAVWHCKCNCGKECDVIGQYLRNNHTQSCGCLQKEKTSKIAQNNSIDLTNKKFNLLIAIEPTERRSGSCIVWKCKCECGNITYVASSDLTHNKVKSCGCIGKSIGEIKIKSILEKNNILFKQEQAFSDLTSQYHGFLRYDFAIYKNNKIIRLIEFDGEHHFKENVGKGWCNEDYFKRVCINDKLKNNYAKEHNIPLVRIPYWERDNITLNLIMGEKYLIC